MPNLKRINSFISPKNLPTFVDKIQNYFYKIELDVVFQDGEIISLNDYIGELKLYYVYEQFIMPVINVSFSQLGRNHDKIANNLDTLTFRLSIGQINVTKSKKALNEIDGSICKYIIKNLPLVTSDYDKKRFRDEEENDENAFQNAPKILNSVDLISLKHININKNTISGIYNNVNLNALLTVILKQSGLPMLINPVNNNSIIPQVILPNLNLSNTIYYLQEVYGIYESGVRLFFDYDRGYCLANDISMNKIMYEKSPFEYENTICYVGKTTTDIYGYYFDKDNKTYNYLLPNIDGFVFNDAAIKNLAGDIMKMQSFSQRNGKVNRTEIKNESSIDESNSSDRTDIKEKHYYSNFDNPYSLTESLAKLNKSALKFTTVANGIEFSGLTMNKSITMSFIDDLYKIYNGTYQIEANVTTFRRIRDNIFDSQSLLEFARLPKGILSNR